MSATEVIIANLRHSAHDVRLRLGDDVADQVLAHKARRFEQLACRLQDLLDDLEVYVGDDPLIEHRFAIDQACAAAREACYPIMNRGIP